MTTNEEIVRELSEAWFAKNKEPFRKHLHADFQYKDPIMEINGKDNAIASMDECPFEGAIENVELVARGDKVVNIFDWVVTAPFQARIPCVEIVTFDGDKVKSSRSYYDTALYPAEFIEEMKQQFAA